METQVKKVTTDRARKEMSFVNATPVLRYRKKPIEVEAVQFNGNFDEIERFVGGDAEFRDGQLLVATLEGPLRASPGDWIIRGVRGEFYPCKPDVFAATYEPAEPLTSDEEPMRA